MKSFRWTLWALSLALAVGGSAAVRGQSLADVAKKEQDRRKGVKQGGKTYTNADLHNVPPATATPAGGAAKPPADAQPEAKDKDAKDPAKDQAYWAGRVKELRAQLDRDQTYAEALQTRINALTRDFVARDDPAQRSVIARDKQKAIDELNRLKQSIENDTKAISALEEEARKAGVPPGWLRS